MKDIQVSVIIPHYNSTELLIKLLKSIGTHDDMEVIVVDDCSTVDISSVEEYIDAKPDVIFLHNDSGVKGAGAARNIGLKRAKGRWLLFADSDDYFKPGYYETIKEYFDSKWDIVYFPPTSEELETGKMSSRHVMYMEFVDNYRNRNDLKSMTEMKYGFCTPWSKLFRKEVLDKNNILFDEIMVSNDIMCITKCAYYSKKVTASDKVIYCVTRGAKSLTVKKNEDRFDTRVNVLIDRYNYLREHLPKKEFGYTHIDRIALARLADVVIEKWGFKKLIEVLGKYKKNHVRFFDMGLLNPVTMVKKAAIEFTWWKDINKQR